MNFIAFASMICAFYLPIDAILPPMANSSKQAADKNQELFAAND
jgi:hypothetical protein